VYSAEVLDHFENPRNTGTLDQPTAAAQVENPACGDVLKLTARVVGGRITEIRFLAKGCVPAIACGSAITELALGKTPGEATSIRREDLVQALGSLPETSNHASHLAMDALSALVRSMGANGR
jgi:nitrogen fixation NifU-like protein